VGVLGWNSSEGLILNFKQDMIGYANQEGGFPALNKVGVVEIAQGGTNAKTSPLALIQLGLTVTASEINTSCDPALYTSIKKMSLSNLAKNVSHPPTVVTAGITPGLSFTVDTDIANALFQVPADYNGGDATITFNWTKSVASTDESTKTVKWQLKYLGVSPGNNCNSGETTLSVQDVYDDNSTSTQIIYNSDTITIPAASLTANHGLSLEIKAITPTGTALADEPVLLGIVFSCEARHRI